MAEKQPPAYDATEPVYSADDRQDPDFVRVSIHIPGLRVKKKLKKKFPPSFVKEPDNANVDPQFQNMSFTLTVTGTKGDINKKRWALRIRQLHHEIIPDDCTREVKEDRVILYLRKLNQGSWYPELEEGLDAYDEEEEAKKKKKKKKKKSRTKSTESSGSRKVNDESGEMEKDEGKDEEDEDESEDGEEDDSEDEEDEAEKSKSSDGKEKDAVTSS